MNGGSVEAHGQLTQDANFRNPKSKYKRSKNVFFVTCIALIVVRVCTELLQLPALFVFLYHTLLLTFGSSTAANWVSFDLNVSCSSCWGYSLINTLKLKKNVGRNLLPRLGVRGGAFRRQNLTRTRLHLASWSVMRNAGCHRHIAGQTRLTRGARSSGCMLIFAAACIYLGAGIDRSCVNKCFCLPLEVSVVYVYKKLRSV